jgi:hypothetical protein
MSDPTAGVSASSRTTPGAAYAPASNAADHGHERTMWVGWIAFAGVMMMMLGAFHAIEGLVAIFQDSYFLVGQDDLVVHVDYTMWGWVHMLVGILVVSAGAAVLTGHMWARVIAVIVAFGSALLNIAFLSAYPIWSTIMIAVDVLVIWAVMVHGREMKDDPAYSTYR